ncbi:hypothetical protein ACVJF2_006039 [Bradyrhizobium sp. USDA 4519]
MRKPPIDPTIADVAPVDATLTVYDEQICTPIFVYSMLMRAALIGAKSHRPCCASTPAKSQTVHAKHLRAIWPVPNGCLSVDTGSCCAAETPIRESGDLNAPRSEGSVARGAQLAPSLTCLAGRCRAGDIRSRPPKRGREAPALRGWRRSDPLAPGRQRHRDVTNQVRVSVQMSLDTAPPHERRVTLPSSQGASRSPGGATSR